MTQKALYKKIASIGLYEDKDIEKANPSRRARENIDAANEIDREKDETMHPRMSDYEEDKLIGFIPLEEDNLQYDIEHGIV